MPHRTFCRNCPAACGLAITVDDGRVASIRGDRDHPISRGYICVKGLASADWHNGEDRLTVPHARTASGSLGQAEIQTVLDEIHGRLDGILAQHGPRSVAMYYGTGVKTNTLGAMALRSWLQNTVGSPYLYSSSTVDQSAKWVTASRLGIFSTGRLAFEEADVVLAVGVNPIISHSWPLAARHAGRSIKDARARGSRLIVIDPRRTEFARHADLHLPVRPNEDAVLLGAMIRIILENGWEDKAFCARFVASLDRLRQAVRGFTPEMAAARAGVAADQIEEAARLFATAGKKVAISGTGPDMSLRSNCNEHLIEALNAICGAYRRAGDTIPNPGVFGRRTAAKEGVIPPDRTWEREPKLWTEDTGLVGGEFPASRIPNEILHGGIKALIVVGGNPVLALGEPETTLRAFSQLDLLVTMDSRLSATARRSHFVIPTTLPYERWDASIMVDSFYPRPFVQVSPPLLAKPAGVLDDWEVFWELSRRARKPLSLMEYKWGGGKGRELWLDMDRKPAEEELMRWLCESADLSFEDMRRHPEGRCVDMPELAIEPAEPDDGNRLDVCPDDVFTELRDIANAIEDVSRAYRLVVRRHIETMNSAYCNASITRRRIPVNYAFMNPDDMARENFEAGDLIEIRSNTGSIVGEVRADPALRDGVLSMSHQWGDPGDGRDTQASMGSFTGHLVSLTDDIETINYMPRQSGVPVDVRIFRSESAGG